MTKRLIGVVLALASALGLGGCGGEDGGKLYCEILLPLAALSAPQGGEGLADYCIECSVGGETYLIVNSYFEGIEAYPIDSVEQDGCGQISFHPAPTVPPGDYTFELSTYRVGDYETGDHIDGAVGDGGDETIVLTVTPAE